MSDPDPASALRRKLSAPASPLELPEMGPARALRVAVSRAAETCATLEAAVTGFCETRLALAEILQAVQQPHLIFMMRAASGATGLALWEPAALSAVIEHLITGRVAPNQNEMRAPTRTDAAVITEILDKIMELFDKSLDGVPGLPPVCGFRTASLLADGRAVSMALEDVAYREYRITIDFASGIKSGDLRLIFPWDPPEPANHAAARRGAWDTDWPVIVKGARAPVEAILYRLSLPLDHISGLNVGDVIAIPVEAIDGVAIKGSNDRTVASGRLGQCNGHRAVRLAKVGPKPAATAAPPQAIGQPPPYFRADLHPAAPPDGAPMAVADMSPGVAPAPVDAVENMPEPAAQQ
jgi:flagellar motor switch protein FliM